MRLASHVMTCPDEEPTARKLSSGKNIVTAKHQIGTPFLVHLRRNLGACPSSDRLYRVREAAYLSQVSTESV